MFLLTFYKKHCGYIFDKKNCTHRNEMKERLLNYWGQFPILCGKEKKIKINLPMVGDHSVMKPQDFYISMQFYATTIDRVKISLIIL